MSVIDTLLHMAATSGISAFRHWRVLGYTDRAGLVVREPFSIHRRLMISLIQVDLPEELLALELERAKSWLRCGSLSALKSVKGITLMRAFTTNSGPFAFTSTVM